MAEMRFYYQKMRRFQRAIFYPFTITRWRDIACSF